MENLNVENVDGNLRNSMIYPLVMTNSAAWKIDGPNRNR